MTRAIAIIGNPKPASRTRDAAERLCAAMGWEAETLELSDLEDGLFRWGEPGVTAAVSRVQACDVIVAACPTFKGTYSGLLKSFLDHFPTGSGLRNQVAIPLQLGASMMHALSPELLLKPVLVELGAVVPAPGLYLLDSSYAEDGAMERWVDRWGDAVQRATPAR